MLETTVEAISGTSIAKQLGVSRQVIVQDIALLRASNENILSTPRGYLLFRQSDGKITRRFRVFHSSEQIEQELNLIVDKGARVMDVIVEPVSYTHLDVYKRQGPHDQEILILLEFLHQPVNVIKVFIDFPVNQSCQQ